MENNIEISGGNDLPIKLGEFKKFVEDNIDDKGSIISFPEMSLFESPNECIIKLVEDNTFMVMGMIDSVMMAQALKPESVDALYKVNSSLCTTAFRLRNLCELFGGTDEGKPITVDLCEVLRQFFQSVHDTLPINMCKNIVLRMNVRGAVYINISVVELTLVLSNLLLNAITHAHSENGRVEIILNRLKNSGKLVISIVDYGIGVDLSKLRRICSAKILELGKRSKVMGVYKGLGLIVSCKLATAMNGSIQAVNHPLGGAAFNLILNHNEETTKIGETLISDVTNNKAIVDKRMIYLAFRQLLEYK